MKFNPYVPNGIAYPGMFIGRLDEIDAINQSLYQTKNENPQHLLFSGERGIGKSSLLHLADLIAKGDINESQRFNFLSISTDLSGVSSQGGIVKQIARELRSKLKNHQTIQDKAKQVWDFVSKWEILGVKYNNNDTIIDPDEAIDDLVNLFANILGTEQFNGIVVLLDEADNPPADAGLGEFVKIFTERMAKRGCSKVVLFLAGQSFILNRLRESHESSLRVFQVLDMKPLTENECNDVIDRGLNTANEKNDLQTNITDEAREFITSLSEGYPHFLQEFSSSAFAFDTDDIIDKDDVLGGAFSENGAIQQLGTKYFMDMYFLKIASEDYRKVLNFMAKYGDSWISRKQIISDCEVTETNIDNALAALKKREIILGDETRKGFYRLPTRSFATWILAVRNNEA